MKILNMQVARRWRAADGIEAFELLPAQEGTTLPPYDAGAHITVHLPNGFPGPPGRTMAAPGPPGRPFSFRGIRRRRPAKKRG